MIFGESLTSECKFHTGHIIFSHGDEKWSCCDGSKGACEPCNVTVHKAAHWPDEEAKLYFV